MRLLLVVRKTLFLGYNENRDFLETISQSQNEIINNITPGQ